MKSLSSATKAQIMITTIASKTDSRTAMRFINLAVRFNELIKTLAAKPLSFFQRFGLPTQRYSISSFILLASLVSPSLFAQTEEVAQEQRWYQIELLVFALRNGESRTSESWRPVNQVSVSYPPNVIDVESLVRQDNDIESPYNLLKEKEKSFDFYVSQMRLNGNFRTLYHQSWRQPVTDRNRTVPVLIQGGRQFDTYHELEGTIKLSVSRYLHIDANLWMIDYAPTATLRDFSIPDNDAQFTPVNATFGFNAASTPVESPESIATHSATGGIRESSQGFSASRIIELSQTRKMRSGELHYLDHPLMGVIVRVTEHSEEKELEDS